MVVYVKGGENATHDKRMKVKTLGLCPKPCKLLKKFDQNFDLKSCVRTILGFNDKVFVELFSKSSWGAGQSPAVYCSCVCRDGAAERTQKGLLRQPFNITSNVKLSQKFAGVLGRCPQVPPLSCPFPYSCGRRKASALSC
jgi:hypothetical protein